MKFRPLAVSDLPKLHAWFNQPHARRWFGDGCTLEELAEEYAGYIAGTYAAKAYVVEHEGRDIGLAETNRLGDHPDVQELYGVVDPDTANCDVILGEESAYQGLGSLMIEALLEQKIFADARVKTCVIDPEVDNMIAIRAYEKVGFRFVRVAREDGDGHACYLMERGRVVDNRDDSGFIIRPAKPTELSKIEEIDADSTMSYEMIGLPINLPPESPFARLEVSRWSAALERTLVLLGCVEGEPVAFASLGHIDGMPHLQQLSVRRAFMRQGIGRALLQRAIRWSTRPGQLWITTYGDIVPWNAPWYDRVGFQRVETDRCGPEVQETLRFERQELPGKEHRVAMVFNHG